jgi:hypothetical protein
MIFNIAFGFVENNKNYIEKIEKAFVDCVFRFGFVI